MNKINLINRFAVVTERLQRLLDRRVAGLKTSPIHIEALQKEMNNIINQLNA